MLYEVITMYLLRISERRGAPSDRHPEYRLTGEVRLRHEEDTLLHQRSRAGACQPLLPGDPDSLLTPPIDIRIGGIRCASVVF